MKSSVEKKYNACPNRASCALVIICLLGLCVTIGVADCPVVNFTANVTSGPAPLTVHFTDLTDIQGESYSWEFDYEGDGEGWSTEQHPVYTYENVGVYTVLLNVNTADCSGTLEKPDYIKVTSATGGLDERITSDPACQGRPAVTDRYIVWVDGRNGNDDIYLYDLVTGQESQLTNDPAGEVNPEISGDHVVWDTFREGNYEICLYTISTGETKVIKSDSTWRSAPIISDSGIIWREDGIRCFDIYSEEEFQVTSSDVYSMDIYDYNIAWIESVNGYPEVFLRQSGIIQQITNDGWSKGEYLAVSKYHIVWIANSDNNAPNVFCYTIRSGNIQQLTHNTPEDYKELMNIDVTDTYGSNVAPGLTSLIVWSEAYSYDTVVVFYDLYQGTETWVSRGGHELDSPRIWGNRIVWEDMQEPGNYDIYMHTLPQARFVTDPPEDVCFVDPGPVCSPSLDDVVTFHDLSYDPEILSRKWIIEGMYQPAYDYVIVYYDETTGEWTIEDTGSPHGEITCNTGNPDWSYRFLTPGRYSIALYINEYPYQRTFDKMIEICPTPNIADFLISPENPRVDDPVTFIDNSTCVYSDNELGLEWEIEYWNWNFGDEYGEYSTDSPDDHPVIQFTEPGYYDVTLDIEDTYGILGSCTKTIFIAPSGGSVMPPAASFTYFPSSPQTREPVQFTDTSFDSDGEIVSWLWDFGDSETSTEQSPVHTFTTYNEDGYTVTLNVTDDDGEMGHYAVNVFVSIRESNVAPVASFSYEPQYPTVFDTVTFTDDSYDPDGSIAAWEWDINGYITHYQNPSYQFHTVNNYVFLAVLDDEGEYNDVYVDIDMYLPVDFTYTPDDLAAGEEICFNDTTLYPISTGIGEPGLNEWSWTFGDGSDASSVWPDLEARNVTHIYAEPGIYEVTLMVTADWYTTYETTKTIVVTGKTTPPPNPAFAFWPTNPLVSETVTFYDALSNDEATTTYYWDFGDDTTDVSRNPTHVYASPGTYQVIHAVSNTPGEQEESIQHVTVSEPFTLTNPVVSVNSTLDLLGEQRSETPWQIMPISWGHDGYYLVGDSLSTISEEYDGFILEIDSNGNEMNGKTFGTPDDEIGYLGFIEVDEGYCVAGYSIAEGSENSDAVMMRTEFDGQVVWTRTFGGAEWDDFSGICNAPGGYLAAGSTGSYSDDPGNDDGWLVMVDERGDEVWNRTYGGPGTDWIEAVIFTGDGFVFSGGSIAVPGASPFDTWLVKVDLRGNVIWEKKYRGSHWDSTVIPAGDGFLIIGDLYNGPGLTNCDARVLHVDGDGNVLWDRTYGGPINEELEEAIPLSDGYLAGGGIWSDSLASRDMWILKIDFDGNEVWNLTYGGPDYDNLGTFTRTVEGGDGVFIAGSTKSFGEPPAEPSPFSWDLWFLKLEEGIQQNLPPTASFTCDPTTPTTADNIFFTDTSTDPDGTISSYYWEFDVYGSSDQPNPLFWFGSPGSYEVTLTVTDDKGGTDSLSQQISVVNPPEGEVTLDIPGGVIEDSTLILDTGIAGDQVTWSDDTITVLNGNLTTIIRMSETVTVDGNGIISGIIQGIQIQSDSVMEGSFEAFFIASMASLPTDATITSSLVTGAGSSGPEYDLAALNATLEVVDVACTFTVVRTNIEDDDATGIISATIYLTAPETWVAENGGPDAVKIVRVPDTGDSLILETMYTLQNGIYTFSAFSDDGLSVYGLVGVRSIPEPGTTVVLFDSLGHGIPDARVQYYAAGWKDLGMTDASGELVLDISPGNYSFRMTYAGSSLDKKQDIGINPVVEFQTVNVQVTLEDSTGAALDPGTAQYYAGGWKEFGPTSGGTVEKELLPGNYTFRIGYAGSSLDKKQDIGINPVVEFQTVNVQVTLKDSTGAAIDPGTVQYYAGGWKEFGPTSGGTVEKELLPGNYTFRMGYAGASLDRKQDITQDSSVEFATTLVTLELRDSSGQLTDTGAASYYAGGWNEIGPTSGGIVTKELLPISYTFRMSYGGKSNDIQQDVAIDPVVVFTAATPIPTVKLVDSEGNGISGAAVQYYAGGWKEFGTTDASGSVSKDILPGTYTFRMSYGGASQDLKQDVSIDPLVEFQTVNVQVTLEDSAGAPLDPATIQYYAGGWKPFGTTTGGIAGKELLPGTYTFRASYEGASLDKKQDVGTDPLVMFQTVKAQVNLKDSTGTFLDTGTVQYYAGGWKSFGTTSGGIAEKELLPGSYSFRMAYLGDTQDIKQDISSGTPVVFSTGKVISDTGTCQQYYAGGWKPFTNGMELLPASYKFRFNDGTPDTASSIVSGMENHIH